MAHTVTVKVWRGRCQKKKENDNGENVAVLCTFSETRNMKKNTRKTVDSAMRSNGKMKWKRMNENQMRRSHWAIVFHRDDTFRLCVYVSFLPFLEDIHLDLVFSKFFFLYASLFLVFSFIITILLIFFLHLCFSFFHLYTFLPFELRFALFVVGRFFRCRARVNCLHYLRFLFVHSFIPLKIIRAQLSTRQRQQRLSTCIFKIDDDIVMRATVTI